jgi:SAM-dependent methyltransferase
MKDHAGIFFAENRKKHWGKTARESRGLTAVQRAYHDLLAKTYAFLIPEGKRILEIGCGNGRLLAALRPSCGVGIDFAPEMIENAAEISTMFPPPPHSHETGVQLHFLECDAHNPEQLMRFRFCREPFDVVIMSDLVNDVWHLGQIFAELHRFCSPSTRVVINFHSHLWERPFHLMQRFGLVTPRLTQNWFTPDDIKNLAFLNDFECIQHFDDILWPFHTPLLDTLCNRYLAKIWPFSIFDLTHFLVLRPAGKASGQKKVSVIIPARNEAGNIEAAVKRTPSMGAGTELVFVEGGSSDGTWTVIQRMKEKYRDRDIKILRQDGKGKGNAVRKGFSAASGDVLMILDADLTVPPETLPQFYAALVSGKAEFVNGVRLVYPQESRAMRFCNLVANKFFSLAFSWLLGRNIKDTLCGTKVLSRENWQHILDCRAWFGDFDPFGDYDLLFGAAKLNLKIVDLPVRYRDRTYGDTNIQRWRHGLILLRMVVFAARRIKFI